MTVLTVEQIRKAVAKADEAGLNRPYTFRVHSDHEEAVKAAIAEGVIDAKWVEWLQ